MSKFIALRTEGNCLCQIAQDSYWSTTQGWNLKECSLGCFSVTHRVINIITVRGKSLSAIFQIGMRSYLNDATRGNLFDP